jgi:phosphoglycolate phosphatase-like HAD superfamily hydrolase
MPLEPSSPATLHPPIAHPGFQWHAAAAYLFDIDGTLLNSRDDVHYFAFQNAVRETLGIEVGLEGLQLHGNTDPGILRAALARKGLANHEISTHLPRILEQMCAEVVRDQNRLQPELCPSIPKLLSTLQEKGKLLGAASGNLEPIGWAKLEKAGVRELFSFGAFSWPCESRVEIFRHGVELARRHLGLHPSNDSVFVVGDTPADIAAARAVGLPVIAVATGIYGFQELQSCNPDLCVASAADLLALF